MKPQLSFSNRVITRLFLLPTILFLALTNFIPILYSIYLSLFNVMQNRPNQPLVFVGFQNFITMFRDAIFLESCVKTILFAVISVFFEMTLGLVLGMMLCGEGRSHRLIRSILMIPMIMAPVAAGTLWRMMLDSSTGVINYLGSFIGLPKIGWLGDPVLAFVAVVFVNVWQLVPWTTIIIVSGLKSISQDVISAALVDGAKPFRIFRSIVLPQMGPILTTAFIIRFIDAFKVFDSVYVMTGGGPGTATEMLPNYIYRQGLNYSATSYAAAIAIVFILFMVVASSGMIKKRLHSQGIGADKNLI